MCKQHDVTKLGSTAPYLSAHDFWHSLVELDVFPSVKWQVYFELEIESSSN